MLRDRAQWRHPRRCVAADTRAALPGADVAGNQGSLGTSMPCAQGQLGNGGLIGFVNVNASKVKCVLVAASKIELFPRKFPVGLNRCGHAGNILSWSPVRRTVRHNRADGVVL
jgi:hypothetical protein